MCRVTFSKGVKGMKEGDKIYLRFKRYVFDKLKQMHQTGLYPQEGVESEAAPASSKLTVPAKEKEKEKPKENSKEKVKESGEEPKGSASNASKKAESKGSGGNASEMPPVSVSKSAVAKMSLPATSKVKVVASSPLLRSSGGRSGSAELSASHPKILRSSKSAVDTATATAIATASKIGSASSTAVTMDTVVIRSKPNISSEEAKGAVASPPTVLQGKKPPMSRAEASSGKGKDSTASSATQDANKDAPSKPAAAAAPTKAVFVNALPDYDRLVSNIKQAVKSESSKQREKGTNPPDGSAQNVSTVTPTVDVISSEKKAVESAVKQVRITPRPFEPQEEKIPSAPPTSATFINRDLCSTDIYPEENYLHASSLSYYTSDPLFPLHPLQQQLGMQPYEHSGAPYNDLYMHRQQQQQQYYPIQTYPYPLDYLIRNDSFAPRAKTAQRMREPRSGSTSRTARTHSQRASSAARGFSGSGDRRSPLKAREQQSIVSYSQQQSTQTQQIRQPIRHSLPPRMRPNSDAAHNIINSSRNSHSDSKPGAGNSAFAADHPDLYAINNTIMRSGTLDALKDPIAEAGETAEVGRQRFQSAIVAGAFKMEENIRNYVDTLCAIGKKMLTQTIMVMRIGIVTIILSYFSEFAGPNGELGDLVGPFGKLGKCKIRFAKGYSGPPSGLIRFVAK